MRYDFELDADDGLILICPEYGAPIYVTINDFWNYVETHGLNEWCDDSYSPNEPDGHLQKTGVYSYDEYFALPDKSIKNDLDKFISENKLN